MAGTPQRTKQHKNDDRAKREEAIRLKTLAESKYNSSSSLKSALKYASKAHKLDPTLPGLTEMLTAFQILNSTSPNPKNNNNSTPFDFPCPEFYTILKLEPFSPLNSIKAQYKKLALLLHPDKSSLKVASCEAFKLVNDAFQVLSDRVKRKEYDTKLRLALQNDVFEGAGDGDGNGEREEGTFWTACSKCRVLHKFERKYVGHCLVCPSCNQGFRAFEVSDEGEGLEESEGGVRKSSRVRVRKKVFGDGWVVSEVGFGNEVSKGEGRVTSGEKLGSIEKKGKMSFVSEVLKGDQRVKNDGKKGGWEVKLKSFVKKGKMGSVSEVLERAKSRRVEVGDDEGRVEVVGEKLKERSREKGLDRGRVDSGSRKRGRNEVVEVSEEERLEEVEEVEEELTLAEIKKEALKKLKGRKEDEKKEKRRKESEEEKGKGFLPLVECGDMEVMVVQDSDFYDFDEDRVERSFKKGQVWAIYDDDDGMPRHYGLIDAVVSVNPFEVKMSWLDIQNNGDERVISWEKMGFHVSCGKFKVAKKDTINFLNIFSHLVECERAARELYRIYPKKGSVWALYNEKDLGLGGRHSSSRDRRSYDIIVLLTSYSEMHGLSMAYLVKVDGFRAVFKRQEIGYHAIRWLEKDDIRLFSHQIPARKLTGNEVPDVSGDCWELDPASLPPDMLAVT